MIAAEGGPVNVACRVLGVSCAGYYLSLSRPPSLRSIRHAWLTDLMRQAHAASHGTYGGRRIHAQLVLGHGVRVGYTTIAPLMRRAGLAGRTGAPRAKHLPRAATAADLVDRQFARGAPNQLWVTDITEHPTREGKIYCAVVLDAYSPPRRRLVDRLIAQRRAVDQRARDGLSNRTPLNGNTLIHSDHGTQFTSWAFTERAKASGLPERAGCSV